MRIVTEFKVYPEHRAAAVDLLDRMVKALAIPGPYTEDHRVEWEALERVGNRVIGAAGAVQHPIGVHSPEFWPIWRRFVERNAAIDVQLRQRRGPLTVACLEASLAMASRPDMEAAADMPADIMDKLGLADLRKAAPGAFRSLRAPICLDNGTNIALIRTEWGEEDVHIEYEGEAPAEAAPAPMTVTTPPAPAAVPSNNGAVPPADADPTSYESLSEAITARLDAVAKELGNRRGDESHGRVLKFALDFLGDRPLPSIRAVDLRRLEAALTEIPNRKGIPRKHATSLFTRYEYARKNGMDGLTLVGQTTLANTYHGAMNAFLKWARTKTDWSPPDFVFNAVGADAPPAQDRDAFSDDELLRFFSLPLFTGCSSAVHFWATGGCFVQNAHYWGYLIHIFMGLRPSEIGKLNIDDLVEDGGMWFLDLRKTPTPPKQTAQAKSPEKPRKLKTAAAFRRVPVPRLLIDLGLADRKKVLEAAKETRLFPEWTVYRHPQSGRLMYGHYLSKSWQYVKMAHSFDREMLTLYSGRHTLAGWYDEMGLPQRIRDRLLGHAPQNVQGNYGPVDLTLREAATALAAEVPIQEQIADVLLTAKLQADYGMLTPEPIYAARARAAHA